MAEPRASAESVTTPWVTLGLAAGVTVLVVGGILLAGYVVQALFVVTITAMLFIVAFATAPLFARLGAGGPNGAAVLGAGLGWVLSAPLGSLVNTASNALYGFTEPFEFLSSTWLWALIPLVTVLIVAGVRQSIARRNRF